MVPTEFQLLSHVNPPCSGWTEYSEWGTCDKPCGGGKESRKRKCLAQFEWQCPGQAEEMKDCNMQPCPGGSIISVR